MKTSLLESRSPVPRTYQERDDSLYDMEKNEKELPAALEMKDV